MGIGCLCAYLRGLAVYRARSVRAWGSELSAWLGSEGRGVSMPIRPAAVDLPGLVWSARPRPGGLPGPGLAAGVLRMERTGLG